MRYSLHDKKPHVHKSVYTAPGTQLIGDIVLEEDVSIWFNAVLRGDNAQINIGKGSNIQDGTIVHVDSGFPVKVGENVTIGHNVTLHGCEIKNGALIGMGSTILNGAVIGEGSLVAACALVTENTVVEPGVMVAGVPAKVIRKLTEKEIENIKKGAQHYVNNGKRYSQEKINAL